MSDDEYISEELLTVDPTEEDIALYCEDLGIDQVKDPDLVWIAYEGYRAPLPPNWKYYRGKKNPDITFFFNSKTGESISEHPLDHVYRELYLEERKKKEAGLPYARSKEELDHPIDALLEGEHRHKKKKHRKKHEKEDTDQKQNNSLDPFEIMSDKDFVDDKEPVTAKNESERQERDHHEKLEEEEGRFNEQMQKLRDDHERRKNDLIAEQNGEILTLIRDFQVRKNQKQSELQRLENEKSDISRDHEKEIQDLKDKNKSEIEQLKAEFRQERKQIELENEQKIEKIREKGNKELENERKQQLSKLENLRASNKKEMAEIKQKYREKVERMKKSHEAKLKEIRSKASEQLSNEKKRVSALQTMSSIYSPKQEIDMGTKFDNVAKLEIDRRERKHEEELAALIAQHASIMAEKKHQFEMQLMEEQKNNTRAIEMARNECESEMRRYRDKIAKEKKNIMKSLRQEALRHNPFDRTLITQRLVSLKPDQKPKIRLHRSAAKSISVYDEIDNNCILTRAQVVFQRRPTKRKQTVGEDVALPFTEERNLQIEPIIQFPKQRKESSVKEKPVTYNENVFVEITEDEHQKLKHDMNKTQRVFDVSFDKVKTKINGVFGSINEQCKDLKSLVQEENRFLTRQTFDFRQQSMEISRAINMCLNELENVHRSAIVKLNVDHVEHVPHPPPQIFVGPPYPVMSYAVAAPQRRPARRLRTG